MSPTPPTLSSGVPFVATTLVAAALVERLRIWGIHRIFGYSGDGIDPILGALNRAAVTLNS